MAVSVQNAQVQMIARNWLPIGAIALAAVLAGMLLPRLVSPPDVPATVPAVKESKAGDLTYAPPDWPDQPDHQAMFVRLGVGTVFVLGLCAATLWMCKRWLTGQVPEKGPGAELRLIETLQLGNRCQIHLVHVDRRAVLIGTDPGGVKSMMPLPETFALPDLEESDLTLTRVSV